MCWVFLSGNLSKDDGDVNEDGKKAIGLDWENNTFARASRFFVCISLPSLHDYNVKMPNFTFCRGREPKITIFFFFSWTLIQSFRIKRDGISAIVSQREFTFKWRFRSRRRCLISLLPRALIGRNNLSLLKSTQYFKLSSFFLVRNQHYVS